MANDPHNVHTYNVPDISCNHCKNAIENHVGALAGVEAVIVDVDAKTVTVNGGNTGEIETAIDDAGYSIA